MKIIIDPYRGGNDTGKNISGQYEKNILLNLSKYMNEQFAKAGIDSELVRTNDVSLTDNERTSIINELKNSNDLIIQNRLSEDNRLEIIYPLRNSDALPSLIANNLETNDINISKYYQRRLPSDTIFDYYSVIRNTAPNETLIIEYNNPTDYQKTVDIIVDTIALYLGSSANTYTVQKGDSLYQIAKKFNTTVDEIKRINNLKTNTLSIGQKLKIPVIKEPSTAPATDTYIVQKGDSLYQIAKKFNTTVDEIKRINNLKTNTLSIGQKLKIKEIKDSSISTDIYIVQKGDSLYQIAKKFNTTIEKLKELNNLKNNMLTIGMELLVPLSNEEYIIYKVKKGDSLYQIAKNYNTTVDELKKLNNLSTNNLSINQELKIPR